MNKNEKDFMNQLSDLDDLSVEEIAENYPVLDEKTKKRIVRKCMKKYRFSADRNNDSEELTVSGTERYNRVTWYKYASSAAALVVAVVGIASVVMIRGNLNVNDDFEIDTPPTVSSDEPEVDSMSEAATATTSKKGYVAGGYDYANDNEYSKIIVGEPSQTPPAVDESSSGNTTEEPSVNNNSNNTPVTQAPVTSPVTQPPTTSPVTEAIQSESQQSFLNGLYYVDIKGISGYMAFDFMPDGTLTKYDFDDYGNVINDTIVKTNYEMLENQFSFDDPNSEFDRKTGIIVNPNDTGNFSVQFEDGLYTFSQETPVFATSGITLSGLWFGNSAYGLRKLEFYSDTSGSFIYTNDITNVEFEYRIENNHVYFIVYGDTLEGDITRDYDGERFTVLWNDGTTEYFYDEKTWWEMNE